jgi:hypothetical protein
VGYDLHISRAIRWVDSEWFPINRAEVMGLIQRHDDLALPDGYPDTGSGGFDFSCRPDDWLWFTDGEIKTKNPVPGLIRRMVDLAAELDAWLTGDDGEVYTWDGREIVQRYRRPDEYQVEGCIITRASGTVYSWEAPILPDAWMALAQAQPDFDIGTRIEALLPSGPSWIICPPVAHWMGHPAGIPLPFLPFQDVVMVRDRDPATVRRASQLAATLGARVTDENDEPLSGGGGDLP